MDANPGAVTRHMQENLCPCQTLKITVISGFRTKIAVVAKYRAKITVHCRGFWLPYKNYCGDQLPCNNYRAFTVVAGYRTKYSVVVNYRPPITVQYLPWWLLTVANVTEMKNRYRGKPRNMAIEKTRATRYQGVYMAHSQKPRKNARYTARS